ncbi:MAG TPA: HD domain-containing phosphohydrolase [Patescibacteria group bacterium]|nr:HD domain-containing phosphohydrolase [Patescibacteria group bacterium]
MKWISIDDIHEGMICQQTICDERGIVLIGRGIKITGSYIQGLKKFHVKRIPIESEEEPPVPVGLANLGSPIAQQSISTCNLLIHDQEMCKIFKVKKKSSQIEQVVYSVLEKPYVQGCLEKYAPDEFLYLHTLRTTILALVMGISGGYNFMNLEYLAICALLHDCGMGTEFEEDDLEHPLQGFVALRDNPDVDMIVALACLQHHERFDGTGFPFRFKKRQITEFARLMSIVDEYDRLLMNRTSPRAAIFKIMDGAKTVFDPRMLQLFESIIKTG